MIYIGIDPGAKGGIALVGSDGSAVAYPWDDDKFVSYMRTATIMRDRDGEKLIAAVEKGALTLQKLEAMTAVCSVGLDMIAIPGDTPEDVINGIIADEIAIGVVNTKTTAVRLIPAYGKKAGDSVEFGGLLGYAPIMEINTYSPAKFIGRGGRIPAPIHSLKN